jgi:4-amino-4-deoxy-L-arabinose transferase-like glycosyltransferase
MTSQPPGETAASTSRRIGWAVLIIVTLYICYFSHLGVIGFVGPDEPRYAWIARDMAETGDWVTPRLYGKPWFEKPPLLYWGGAIFFKLFGSSSPEVAARLPSAICALLATLALAWLAWRAYGEECARRLLLLLPTSVGMIGFSHAAATDMPFAGMLTIAMVCAAFALGVTQSENTAILPRTPWLPPLLFGFFLGLAVLAKGPAAIILSGGAVFFWAIFTKRRRDALRLLHPAAIAAFCVTALPWYILCAHRNPNFLRIFIIEHNFKRYLTPEFQHVQPFWFYIPILLAAFLPWSFLISVSGAAGTRRWWRIREMSPVTCLILCWVTFCLVFFSISKSKLPGYVLPVVPPIGFLLSQILSAGAVLKRRTFGVALVVSGVTFLGTAIYFYFQLRDFWRFVPINPHRLSFGQTIAAFVISLIFFLITVCAAASFWTPSNSAAEFWFLGVSVLAFVFLMQFSALIVDRARLDLLSGKVLAVATQQSVPPGEQLRVLGFRRDYRYALSFYRHEEVPDWTDNPMRNGFILANGVSCEALKTKDLCRNLWENLDLNRNWSLLRITPTDSLDGPGSGRQPRQEK